MDLNVIIHLYLNRELGKTVNYSEAEENGEHSGFERVVRSSWLRKNRKHSSSSAQGLNFSLLIVSILYHLKLKQIIFSI